VLADSEQEAGIASGVNNAVARVAGLLGTVAVGAAVAASFASSLDSRLRGIALSSSASTAVRQAKHLALGLPDTHGLPDATAQALRHAAEQASLHAFHLSLAIAAGLVALGGAAGAIGVRNPSRAVPARECPGGSLVGASRHLGRAARLRAATAPERSQPTGSRA
jgi:hypothetical protein